MSPANAGDGDTGAGDGDGSTGDGDGDGATGDGDTSPGDGDGTVGDGDTGTGDGDGDGTGGDGDGDGDGPDLPPPSTFTCDSLPPVEADVSARSCFDFTDNNAAGWQPEGGEWQAQDGAYTGTGPLEPVNCAEAGSNMTASLLQSVSAKDVRVHAHLTGAHRADKVIVLRARDSKNRIEINFRSAFEDEGKVHQGDLIVQELVDCTSKFHVMPDAVALPHDEYDALEVDVELRGQALRVSVNGDEVFNETVAVAEEPGKVGVGVILGGSTRFDDFVVETLD